MEPASIRYKNPGAMWPGKRATRWGSRKWVYLNDGTGQGGNGKGNKIAIFDTYEDGIAAQLDLWRTSKNYRNRPFKDAIHVWSGGNFVESYIKFVLARVPGMTRDTVMDDTFWRGPNGIGFLKAQAWHEAGKPYPASDADYRAAQKRVFAKNPPKEVAKPKPVETHPEPSNPTQAEIEDQEEHNQQAEHSVPPFWKRPFIWLGSLITGGTIGGAAMDGGASFSIDAQFMWGLSAFVIILFGLLLGWVYLIPPRGKLKKGLS